MGCGSFGTLRFLSIIDACKGTAMTANCCVFIATSLDGFIARSDGSIDWLNKANESVTPGEDCGYSEFMADVDALVMGRNTFEQVLTFESWPYGSIPVIVLSQRGISLPPDLPPNVSVSNETPSALVARLTESGIKKIYVDGGLTIQSFLSADLIVDITITVIPVLLGSGRSLFGALSADVHLAHESTTAFEFGFVQNRYRVIRNAQRYQ
jgi:dihydrofolate reductase